MKRVDPESSALGRESAAGERDDAQVGDVQPELQPADGRGRPRPASPPATILVVEDEALVRTAVQHYLTAAGYRVLIAIDGGAALAHAEQHDGAIDLILADLSLPDGTTGPQIAAQIQRQRPRAGILYMTACPADLLARRGFALSKGEALEKPFSKEALLGRVAAELAATTARLDAAGREPDGSPSQGSAE